MEQQEYFYSFGKDEEKGKRIYLNNTVSTGDFLYIGGEKHIVVSVSHAKCIAAHLLIKKVKKTKRFKKPTQEEVDAFANESNLQQDGFFDYFESNGWKAGRNPMKDWKAALRGWSRRQSDFNKKEGVPKGLGDPNMEW